jgi:hypothetical protein
MNRHQRRQAALAKQNKFVTDYVQHLPEVGPEVIWSATTMRLMTGEPTPAIRHQVFRRAAADLRPHGPMATLIMMDHDDQHPVRESQGAPIRQGVKGHRNGEGYRAARLFRV